MKGIFFIPINKPDVTYSKVLDSIIEEVTFCDKNNFSEAFFGEHMADKYEKVSSSLTLISSLSKITKRIKLGTMTSNIIFFHPAVLASHISTVDNLASGRLQLGIGCGSNQCDLEITQRLGKENFELMIETLDVVKKILYSQSLLNIKSKNFKISSINKGSKELMLGYFDGLYKKRKNLEIILPVLSKNSNNIKTCAKNKWSFLSSNFVAEDVIKNHVKDYKKYTLQKTNYNKSKIKVARFIFVAENDKEAEKYLLHDKSPYIYMINVIKSKLAKSRKSNVFGVDTNDTKEIAKKIVIYGAPDTVQKKIKNLKKNIGGCGSMVYTSVPSLGRKIYKESLKLFAHEVKI